MSKVKNRIRTILSRKAPMRPMDLLNAINPPPKFSVDEVNEALSDMIESREIELTSDRYIKFRSTVKIK